MSQVTELLKRLRGDVAVRSAQRQIQADIAALKQLIPTTAPSAPAPAPAPSIPPPSTDEIGLLTDLTLVLKEGDRVATWPQVVKSRRLEVRPLPISAESRFLALGSCFVNEIRHYLEHDGVAVYPMLSAEIQALLPDDLKVAPAWGAWDERVHYQNYTPFSIEQEIDLALGDFSLDDAAILKIGDRYWDPYRRGVYAYDLPTVLEVRERMNAALAHGVKDADVAIITLGSIEAFTVKEFGGYVPEFKAHLRNSVDFVDPSLEDISSCIDRICTKLLDGAGFEKVVLTVSPIPMSRTHRDEEVALRNCYAKSALRASVENAVQQYDDVHYFPSYEYVTMTGGFRTTDYTHVRSEVVAQITAAFLSALK